MFYQVSRFVEVGGWQVWGFNDYFSNIGPDLASKIDTPNLNFQTHIEKAKSEFSAFQPVTVSNVYHLLHGLSSNKATGVDNCCAEWLYYYLK